MVNGTRVKVLRCETVLVGRAGHFIDDALTIACGEGAIRCLELQREGKGRHGCARFSCAAFQLLPERCKLMPRYRLLIEYDGSGLRAGNCRTTSQLCRACLKTPLKNCTVQHCLVYGAGRTDAGVHALAQVAHVDLPKSWDPFVLAQRDQRQCASLQSERG